MRKFKVISFMVVILAFAPVFADEGVHKKEEPAINALQVQRALNLLIKAGVLSVNDKELVVTRPTILEELESLGRTTNASTLSTVVCFKQGEKPAEK